jgi:hypothetical protein
VLMASVELDGFHSEEEDTPAECRKALLSALSRACEESRRGAAMEAARVCGDLMLSDFPGYRQALAEAARRLRSLASSPGAPDPRDAVVEAARALVQRVDAGGMVAFGTLDTMRDALRALSAASSTPAAEETKP